MKIKITYAISAQGRPMAEMVIQNDKEGWSSCVLENDDKEEKCSCATVRADTWAEVEKTVTEKIAAAKKLLAGWRELEKAIPEALEMEI